MTIKTTLQQLMGGTTPIIEGYELNSLMIDFKNIPENYLILINNFITNNLL